ncbi:DNA-binding response regulator [Cytophagales bacterium WSM2-2]|nr:DNA-binding response regulator [Cytophagales bacterium WSM2-2]
MIRCLIIDDEPLARKLLEEFISKTPELTLAGSVQNALAARTLLTKQKVDVLFLDIQMPDLTGIDFLKTLSKRPLIIFTTAYAEYALEGFELDVVDYLLKPFDFNRYLKAVNKISERLGHSSISSEEKSQSNFIFVKDGTKLVRIDLKTILYIKGAKEYVTIVTTSEKIMSLMSMKNLEEMLSSEFVRIHNSFIARLDAVRSISKDEVEIGADHLPIGATYKKQLMSRISSYRKDL